MSDKEKEAIDLCFSLLRGIVDRNNGEYAKQVKLGRELLINAVQKEEAIQNSSSVYQDALKEEIGRYFKDNSEKWAYSDVARHFANWQRRYDIEHLHEPIRELGESVC